MIAARQPRCNRAWLVRTLRWQSESPLLLRAGRPPPDTAPSSNRCRRPGVRSLAARTAGADDRRAVRPRGGPVRSTDGAAASIAGRFCPDGSAGWLAWVSRWQSLGCRMGRPQILSNVLTAVQLVPAGASRPRFLRQLPACSSSTGTQHPDLSGRGPQSASQNLRLAQPRTRACQRSAGSGSSPKPIPDLANRARASPWFFFSGFLPSQAVGHPSMRPPRVGHAAPRAGGPWLGTPARAPSAAGTSGRCDRHRRRRGGGSG